MCAYFFFLHCCVMGKSRFSNENGAKKEKKHFPEVPKKKKKKKKKKTWVGGLKVGR